MIAKAYAGAIREVAQDWTQYVESEAKANELYTMLVLEMQTASALEEYYNGR